MPHVAAPKINKQMHAKSLQSCLTLCDPMDCSPPVPSVHGILQARILEWVAMASFRGYFQPRDWTHISCVSCIAGGFFTTEPLGKPDRSHTRFRISWFPSQDCFSNPSLHPCSPSKWPCLIWELQGTKGVWCYWSSNTNVASLSVRKWGSRSYYTVNLLQAYVDQS